MDKISRTTPDLTQENIKRLTELFPRVTTEVKDENGVVKLAVDFDALRDLLGDVAEGKRERYQFTWPGKAEAKLEARKPCDKTLRPHPEKSVDWDTTQNVYIEGDNLDALKVMRETYAGKVKLIYIDPPYNTGHDFIYDDDFAQTREEYDAQSGEYDEEGGRLVANTEGNGRFHSDWCSMMYPRLLLARDLLADNGALFISIDDNEEANLIKISDEIFGKQNFVAKLSVQINPRGRNLDRYIAKTIEPVVIYVKNYDNPSCLNPIPKDERMLAEYNREDSRGRYRLIGLRNRNQRFNPQTRPNLYFPLWINPETGHVSTSADQDHSIERLPLSGDDVPTCWTWSKQKIKQENEYIIGERSADGWRVFRKDYLDEGDSAMTLAKSLQMEPEFNNDYGKKRIKELFGSNVMSFPKSPELMQRIVEIGSSDGDLVMDFFSGSATLADAVMAINADRGEERRFIMIQLPEEITEGEALKAGLTTICEIGEERIRRAGAKIASEIEETNRQLKLGEDPKPVPDIGFRVFSIDSSNFLDTYIEPGEQTQASLLSLVDNLKEDRTPEDLLFQVLPAFRIPYSAHVEKMDIASAACFNVNDGQLVACFDTEVSTAAIEKIAQLKPIYAVFRDASFASDSDAANFEELFKTYSPDTVRRVI